ncbi:M20 metallopeptidase family protein [Alkalihalobacterium chitinilyticum]|uniref:M20 family metallopeptidase n=1 Tax=Alkalihalobacterium chitinilyticum TaxID=2980103 RepID=A0ABT5VHU7_9BACI|nr:M20 family metallopeptidase [Alkalihalobacterium chitinilyticum]MDE5414984.1 M20 family metallopeptidase [Alkalihalobacterium chitinilyticum]
MKELLNKGLDAIYSEMVDMRRYLHQYPELSFQEEKTPAYIAEFHKNLGHEVKTGVGERGVVAILRGSKPGKTIALRADFDGLPIQDEKEVPYKSKVDGAMHACGHDGHTASLLGLAKVFNSMKEQLSGTVVFIHQHAEEYAPGGAIAMIQDGCLDGVDYVFGTHLWATEPLGKIQYRKGPIMAAADRFEVEIHGQGGHGAMPHLTKDAVVIGAQLVTNLQQLVSRRVDPLKAAVLSIGSFQAQNAFNVIADSAKLIGTVRTFDEDIRTKMEQEIKRIIDGTTLAADVSATYHYFRGYPAVVNHDEETEVVATVANKVPGVYEAENMDPQMGGEDFAYYLQHVKGSFFFTGARNPEWNVAYPHHHPKFDFDERAMLIAAKTLGHITLHYLGNEDKE